LNGAAHNFHFRLSLQQLVRRVGRKGTTQELIDISQKRGRLLARLSAHQHQARRWLQLEVEEEDDRSYGFRDGFQFEEDDDGDITLQTIEDEGDLFDPDDLPEKPELFQVALPSSLGISTCTKRHLMDALASEIKLREGQCNDALQTIRLAVARKSFVYRTEVRLAENKDGKTRAYRQVQRADATLQYHAQVYRQSRNTMKSVKAVTSLLRFRDLRPEDLKTTTTFLNHKERGIKHKNLAWFWYLDVEGDSLDDNAMGECESLFSYSFWTLTII
jgi:hypothetical protein